MPKASAFVVGAWIAAALVATTAGLLVWRARVPTESSSLVPTASNRESRAPDADGSKAAESMPLVQSEPAREALVPPPAGEPIFFGTVHDPDGTPIAGATVTLYPNNDTPLPESIGKGVTGSDGHFAFSAAPTSSSGLTIAAEAQGFSANSMNTVAAGQEIPIQLNWAVAVAGVVSDARSGAPLPRVELTSWDKRTFSDEHGNYRLDGFNSGSTPRLRAQLAGYAAMDQEIVFRGKQDQRMDLALTPGVSVDVEVFDQETGSPLASVAVSNLSDKQPWAHTDARGHLETWIAPGHPIELELALDGYWSIVWSWTPDIDVEEPHPRVPMLRQSWVEGRITDEVGAPISEARVYDGGPGAWSRGQPKRQALEAWGTPGSVHHDPRRMGEGGLSDVDGRYRLPIVPSETPFTLRAGKRGFVSVERASLVLARSSDSAAIDFELAHAAIVHGTARHDGKPWRGRVVWRPAGGTVRGTAWVSEKYSLDDVAAGTWVIALDEHRQTDLPSSTITVEAGQSYELDFVWGIEPVLGTIAGRVRGVLDRSAERVFVSATEKDVADGAGDTARVGADGSFVLSVPAGKTYSVSALRRTKSGTARSESKVVVPDASGIELALPEIGLLQLRLVDAGTGVAVRPTSGSLTDALHWKRIRDDSRRSENVDIDARGGLEVELETGDYEIQLDLSAEGYLPVAPQTVTVGKTPAEAPYVFEFVRGLEARVRLTGPEQGDRTPLKDHVLFLVERAQLGSISGPYPRGDPHVNHSFGGSRGIQMRIDDPTLMNQFLGDEEFFGKGAVLRALRQGHYFVKSYPDDISFEPAEFDLSGPDRAQLAIAWRPR